MNHPDDRPDALPEDPHPDEGRVGITPDPAGVPAVPEEDVEPDSEPEAVAEASKDAPNDPHEADFENISLSKRSAATRTLPRPRDATRV